MKLLRKEWNGKVDFVVGTIKEGDDGEMYGLKTKDVFTGTVVAKPWITRKGFVFPSGKTAQFNNVKCLFKDVSNWENEELNEWKNASFQLPSSDSFISALEALEPLKGKRIQISLETFEKEIDGKNRKFKTFKVKDVTDEVFVKEERISNDEPTAIRSETLINIKEAFDNGELSDGDVVKATLNDGSTIEVTVKEVLAEALANKSF